MKSKKFRTKSMSVLDNVRIQVMSELDNVGAPQKMESQKNEVSKKKKKNEISKKMKS